jgi:hypothetical protein
MMSKMAKKRTTARTADPDPKLHDREVRRVAGLIRSNKQPRARASLLREAEAHLAMRARYNARRARVRELAALRRRGEPIEAPADIIRAVEKHLRYREEYNEERRLARSRPTGAGRKTGPARLRTPSRPTDRA